MITINLLPHGMRPVKRTPLPYILSVAALIAVIFGVGVVFLADTAKVLSARKALAGYQQELDALQPVVAEYNDLTEQKNQLAEQVRTIDEIASDRIIWSRQLHNLSRLVLENVWYSDISVSVKPFTETITRYNPETKRDEVVNEQIQRQVLTVAGYVIAGSDGQSDASPFTRALAEDDEFSSMFELDLPSFKDTEVENIPVRKFNLEYVVMPKESGNND